MDPHLQHTLDNPRYGRNRFERPLESSYATEHQRRATGLGIDLSGQRSNHPIFGRSHNANSSPYPLVYGPQYTPGRMSLPTIDTHNPPAIQPRTLLTADNHFKFTPNLRHGMSGNSTENASQDLGLSNSAGLHRRPLLLGDPLEQPVSGVPTFLRPDTQLDVYLDKDLQPDNPLRTFYKQRSSQIQAFRNEAGPAHNSMTSTNARLSSDTSFRPLELASSSPNFSSISSPTARLGPRRVEHPFTPSSRISDIGDMDMADVPENLQVMDQRLTLKDTPATPQVLSHAPTTKFTLQTLNLGHAPPMANGIQLVSLHALPDRLRQIFPYQLFNAVQSKCFEPIYKSNDNIVVAAPTGSGKTALLELAICKLIEGHKSGQFKIVYLAPTKSLCTERLKDWGKKFSPLNLPCAELTGDTHQGEMDRARDAAIIVTTPEKWDSITRKWTDHIKLVQMVKLFLIDEVHILRDPRGATLEAVVSRMKTMGANIRFVALSATVPNSEDIALWLGKDHTNQHVPAHRELFGENFRPVKLEKFVHGFDGSPNDFAFEKMLDGKLCGLIQRYTQNKPIMVFCNTKKSCESTARTLAEDWITKDYQSRAWPVPTGKIVVSNKDLQDLVNRGVAFHHAGLDPQDRYLVEKGYLEGIISVICCTSTLAVGMNFPCHLVVLKGTVGWQGNKLSEYSDLDIMQMLGRAGRPQFDDTAVAIIMTRKDRVKSYERMVSGHEVLESTLHLNLIEHLNSEISLGSITSLYQAKKWLMGTFLSVRMRQNPRFYKIDGVADDGDTDQRLELVCVRDIKLLQEHQLVSEGDQLKCTEYGQAMTRYMVQFESMKTLIRISAGAKAREILETICQAAEYQQDVRIKQGEKTLLRELNKSPLLRFPVKDPITTTNQKVSLIVQVDLGGIEYPIEKDFAKIKRQYLTDRNIIFDRLNRLIRCVIDCKIADRDAFATRHGLDLARSISAGFWENSNLQLRQVHGIGVVGLRKLVENNVDSIERLAALDTAAIEMKMSKNPPFGKKIKDALAHFPRLLLTAKIQRTWTPKSGGNPMINIRASISYSNAAVPVWAGRKPSVTFIAGTSDGKLVHFWRGNISQLQKAKTHDLDFNAEIQSPSSWITCWFSCEEIVGTFKTTVLQPKLPTAAFPPPRPVQPNSPPTKVMASIEKDDLFGDDDIGDDDMLEAMKGVETMAGTDNDGFVDIDALSTTQKAKPAPNSKITPEASMGPEKQRELEGSEAVKLPNGNWRCHHTCWQGKAGGGLCKHACCLEGLKNKPRPSKKKKKTESDVNGKVLNANDCNDAKAQADTKLKSRPFSPSEITGTEHVDMSYGTSPMPNGRINQPEQRGVQNNMQYPASAAYQQFASNSREEAHTAARRVKNYTLAPGPQTPSPRMHAPPSSNFTDVDMSRFDSNFFSTSPKIRESAPSSNSRKRTYSSMDMSTPQMRQAPQQDFNSMSRVPSHSPPASMGHRSSQKSQKSGTPRLRHTPPSGSNPNFQGPTQNRSAPACRGTVQPSRATSNAQNRGVPSSGFDSTSRTTSQLTPQPPSTPKNHEFVESSWKRGNTPTRQNSQPGFAPTSQASFQHRSVPRFGNNQSDFIQSTRPNPQSASAGSSSHNRHTPPPGFGPTSQSISKTRPALPFDHQQPYAALGPRHNRQSVVAGSGQHCHAPPSDFGPVSQSTSQSRPAPPSFGPALQSSSHFRSTPPSGTQQSGFVPGPQPNPQPATDLSTRKYYDNLLDKPVCQGSADIKVKGPGGTNITFPGVDNSLAPFYDNFSIKNDYESPEDLDQQTLDHFIAATAAAEASLPPPDAFEYFGPYPSKKRESIGADEPEAKRHKLNPEEQPAPPVEPPVKPGWVNDFEDQDLIGEFEDFVEFQ